MQDTRNQEQANEPNRTMDSLVQKKEEVLDRVTEAARDITTTVADAGSDASQAAKQQVSTLRQEVEGLTQRNPLGALAGAFFIGVVVGLMRRR